MECLVYQNTPAALIVQNAATLLGGTFSLRTLVGKFALKS